jgi:predicted outer membrane repeat protein
MTRASLTVGLCATTLILAVPWPARACVVGTGRPATCAETALDACLPDGASFDGTVTFACGSLPHTITITSTKTISHDTSLNGGRLIAISGVPSPSMPVFLVLPGVNLIVENLAIANCNGLGIGNEGSVTVINSTFTGNDDGAIYNDPHGRLTVTDSTFAGNTGSSGGAIYNPGGTVTVTNSTFTGNSNPSGGGGGINDTGGAVTVTNSTFTNNSALGGGGIHANGTVTVTNSIFTKSPSGGNCYASGGGVITDGGHNIDDGTSCGFSPANGSLNNTDPLLDPAGLANNGGPTQTIALEAGSPAINAGDETICAAPPVNNLDQRGFVRPGIGATSCSIGAYEFNSPTQNRDQVSCESAVANKLLKLAVCIKKCHNKWARHAQAGNFFDEEACEQTCRAAYNTASAKLVAKGTCPTCLDATGQGNLADSMMNFLDGQFSNQLYCAGPPPNP